MAVLQFSTSLNNITKAVEAAGRAVAICTSYEDAQHQAQVVAESAISDANITDISTEVSYVTGNDTWESGAYLTVTVAAKYKNPFFSGESAKTALITGAGQGIGRSIALALAEHGANIIINYRSNQGLAEKTLQDVENEINILVATDVLAEGLNLQDASCLINYELHWNPVRLMQRIGRVDRRRNLEIEKKLLADHPEYSVDREKAFYWNFLPPVELEKLLSLYETVSKKTLRISKTFGIEGKKLLTPDDDYEALKEFNSQYEGETSSDEEMALAYQDLMADNPGYEDIVSSLPKKMHSGKGLPIDTGFFFCYELPTKRADGQWTDGDGLYRWYFVKDGSNQISEQAYDIWKLIQCTPDTNRVLVTTEGAFSERRKLVESHIKRTYMRAIQAPLGVKIRLVTWMQIC